MSHLLSEPKMLFSSVTAEQEELVAKMLASGMDEATAYQYLQQLCGVAGKGSKPTLTPYLLFHPHPQKCCTAISLLTPTSIFRFTNTCQRAGNVQSLFLFWVFFISCFFHHSIIILQLCATNVVCQQPPPPA